MWSKRIQELFAMMVAGEGVLAILQPARHARLWQSPTGWTRRAMQPFVEYPWVLRVIAGLQLAAAVAWATRLDRD